MLVTLAFKDGPAPDVLGLADAHWQADAPHLPGLLSACKEESPLILALYGDCRGNALAPRLAYGWNAQCVLNGELRQTKEGLCILCSAYGGNLQRKILLDGGPWVITLKQEAAEAPLPSRSFSLGEPEAPQMYAEEHIPKPTSGLGDAKLAVIGGKGMGPTGFGLLGELAAKLGAGLGATRAAALNGYMPMDTMVGQSGISLSAELAMAFGASGAMAFMNGLEHVRTIVAVNTDPSAPIFQRCDLGIVGDAQEIAQALITLLEENSHG